jgi:hypothetical protein
MAISIYSPARADFIALGALPKIVFPCDVLEAEVAVPDGKELMPYSLAWSTCGN